MGGRRLGGRGSWDGWRLGWLGLCTPGNRPHLPRDLQPALHPILPCNPSYVALLNAHTHAAGPTTCALQSKLVERRSKKAGKACRLFCPETCPETCPEIFPAPCTMHCTALPCPPQSKLVERRSKKAGRAAAHQLCPDLP